MKPHRFDPISFVFGLLFLAMTSMAATGRFSFDSSVLTWIGAAVLLLIGVVMLSGSRNSERKKSSNVTVDED